MIGGNRTRDSAQKVWKMFFKSRYSVKTFFVYSPGSALLVRIPMLIVTAYIIGMLSNNWNISCSDWPLLSQYITVLGIFVVILHQISSDDVTVP